MKRFKPGQEVVCIASGLWSGVIKKRHLLFFTKTVAYEMARPKLDEVVTVIDYNKTGTHVALKEYPTTPAGDAIFFNEVHFAPLPELTELFAHLKATENWEVK